MNLSKFFTYDVIIAFVVLISCIILILYFRNNEKVEKLDNAILNQIPTTLNPQNDNSNEEVVAEENNKQKLYYFGGHHCPHSNINSHMYRFITQRLVEKYPEIDVVILWGSEPNSQEMFRRFDVQYVPTVVNENGNKINVGLPEGINVDNKNDEEVEDIVIENLKNQL